MKKKCSKCGKEKDVSEFSPNGIRNGEQRYRSNCKLCWKEIYKQDPQKYIDQTMKYYSLDKKRAYIDLNREHIQQVNKIYSENHRDQIRETSKEWYENNKKRHHDNVAQWKKDNPHRTYQIWFKYYLSNRAEYAARCGLRRAILLNATPVWVDRNELREFYRQSRKISEETGIKHVVDHIVPLQGVNVSGLHVPWNLQILTESENSIKSNKF